MIFCIHVPHFEFQITVFPNILVSFILKISTIYHNFYLDYIIFTIISQKTVYPTTQMLQKCCMSWSPRWNAQEFNLEH